ncbi:MAG TPA: HD domain-containing protein [Thermoanaerobaculia bacterium]|nr:HD domain-containing protein [Thermoanaerobaculia bacterium]
MTTNGDHLPSRDEAWEFLCRYTEKEGLRKHALAVEAAMRHYARLFGEDEELWGLTGLLHDFDYERWPDPENHPYRGNEILTAEGYPETLRTAILGHAPYTGVPRETRLAKALYACDELAGFVVAVALIKPSKSLADVDLPSVKKRLKEKAFARGVHREDVYNGADEIGLPLDEHIENVIQALRAASDRLGM